MIVATGWTALTLVNAPRRTDSHADIVSILAAGAVNRAPDKHTRPRKDFSATIQLAAWIIRDNTNHPFTLPRYLIRPGEVCRVYIDEFYSKRCRSSYGCSEEDG